MKTQRDDENAVKSWVLKAGLFVLLTMFAKPASAEEASEQTVRIDTVEPAVFGAGAEVVLKGAGFSAEDTVYLGTLLLENAEITPTSIRAKVPEKAKSGTSITLKKGKKKAATVKTFTFAKTPVVKKTAPSFGVPGGPVKLYGSELAAVTELKIGDTVIKIDAASKTMIAFTVPEKLTTGPLSVSGPGGTATMKAPFEVFYAPVIEKTEPTAAFPGETVTVTGKHFDTKGIRFYIGTKAVKTDEVTAEKATFEVKANTASDVVKVTARGITHQSASAFTVYAVPDASPSPSSVGSPGTVKMTGKNLDVVEKWSINGQKLEVDSTYTRNSSKLVQLIVPDDLTTEGKITAAYKGREFPAKKTSKISATPHIGAVRFATGASDKECAYTVLGKNFGKSTSFKVGTKKMTVSSATENSAVLTVKSTCAKAGKTMTAQNGGFKGNVYSFNPAGDGYTLTPEEAAAELGSGVAEYTPEQIQSDLAMMDARFAGTPASFAAEGQAAAGSAEQRTKVDQISEDVGIALLRLALAEASLCTAMASGKNSAAANEPAGRVLEAVATKQKSLMNNVLIPLWSKLPKAALAKGVRLDTVDGKIMLIEANDKKNNPCAGKYYGKKLVAEAEKTAAVNLSALHEQAVTGALSNLSGKTTNAVIAEKELNDALYSFTDLRRTYWMGKAKSASSKMQKSESTTVGKGAGKNKEVEKSSSQKPQGNTGKGKGK